MERKYTVTTILVPVATYSPVEAVVNRNLLICEGISMSTTYSAQRIQQILTKSKGSSI